MEEIKTTKSGNNKIRKDSFYVDPVSGYMFCSFQDAVRYLETNDIKKCTCRPIRKNYDVKLSEDENPAGIQSNLVNEKLSGPIEIVGASSGPKELEASSRAVNLKKHFGGSPKKSPEMVNKPELAKEVAESDVGLMTDDTNQKFPENGMEIETSGSVRKTKKRTNPSVLLRSSKRLQGSEPEIPSDSNLNERALRSAVMRSSGRETNISPVVVVKASTILPSDVEPAKDASFAGEEISDASGDKCNTVPNVPPSSVIEAVKEGTELPSTLQENELTNEVIENLMGNEAIPVEQNGVEPGDDNIQPDTQQSFMFGGIWSDPCINFAFRTLTGEISIDVDPFAFPDYVGDQLGNPLFNPAERFLGSSSETIAAKIDHTDIPAQTEAWKQHGVVNPTAEASKQHGKGVVDPSMEALKEHGNIVAPYKGFNGQQSGAEANKKDY